MKIVILGTAHPYRGGLAAMNERLARELTERGDEVVIYNFTLQYPGFLFPGKSQYTDEPAPQGLRIIRKINSVNPFNWLKVGRELRKICPDLILVKYWLPFMGPALGTIVRLARRNRHTRVICIADNMIPHEKRPGDRLFTKYFTKGVDGYIAMSHEVYEDIEKLVAHPRRRFTPHPIYDHYGEIMPREEALKLLQLDPDYRYLLFFGFIRDYKGLDWLIRAMAEPQLKDRQIRLIVAGEFYSDSEPYLKLIRELGLEEKIILHTDYIPDVLINRYFGAADLVVQPYKTATQSGVTQIGYHFNKAMLVTDVGGLGEIVANGKSGYVVKPGVSAIAEAIADFYDRERQTDFEKETVKLKGQFSWSKMTDVMMELYADINSKNES